jgi:hypothetical protein
MIWQSEPVVIPPNQTIKINRSLTVDFDGTFWASCSHFIGGFDSKFTSWGTVGTGNDESIKSIRILGDFEAGTLGDIGITFPPGNGRSWQAVDLSFQYKLLRENYVSKLYLRTEVRGDFNIHGTKKIQDAVFHQKSKDYDVLSLLYLWLAKKTRPLHEVSNQPGQYFM